MWQDLKKRLGHTDRPLAVSRFTRARERRARFRRPFSQIFSFFFSSNARKLPTVVISTCFDYFVSLLTLSILIGHFIYLFLLLLFGMTYLLTSLKDRYPESCCRLLFCLRGQALFYSFGILRPSWMPFISLKCPRIPPYRKDIRGGQPWLDNFVLVSVVKMPELTTRRTVVFFETSPAHKTYSLVPTRNRFVKMLLNNCRRFCRK